MQIETVPMNKLRTKVRKQTGAEGHELSALTMLAAAEKATMVGHYPAVAHFVHRFHNIVKNHDLDIKLSTINMVVKSDQLKRKLW